MKTLYYVLFFLVILAFSCSEDDMLNTGQDIDQLSSNDALKACRAVIKVYPNSTDDTQNLIDAFAQATARGTIVKLMPGTFKIGMIEVKEFNGTFSGSGKGITFITNIPDLNPDEVIGQNKLPALITFIGGNVSVSDLLISLSEGFSWIGQDEGQYEMNMLLFSDYSTNFTPAKKHIGVNLNNIEVTSIQQFYYPWYCFTGAKFGPDMLRTGNMRIPRSNIDATVTNSKFSNFTQGILVQGCKKGNIMIGLGGGNIFAENTGSLWVLENMGVNVKIMKNEFNVPEYAFDGIDLNAYDRGIFEYAPSIIGIFVVRDNIFNIHMSEGFGLYDNWRYDHPENPVWMKMIWEHNTFNVLDGAYMGRIFGIKDAIFLNNKIVGNAPGGHLGIYGSWLPPEDEPNYSLLWTENCKFLNNLFQLEDFVIDLDLHTKDCLILGDLRNVTVNDAGVNNKVIRITH